MVPPGFIYKTVDITGQELFLGSCPVDKAVQFAKAHKAVELYSLKAGKWIKIDIQK